MGKHSIRDYSKEIDTDYRWYEGSVDSTDSKRDHILSDFESSLSGFPTADESSKLLREETTTKIFEIPEEPLPRLVEIQDYSPEYTRMILPVITEDDKSAFDLEEKTDYSDDEFFVSENELPSDMELFTHPELDPLDSIQAGPGSIIAIIPAHNEESSISATVDSVLVQTKQVDLIIVMADNCSDDTVRIVQDYNDPRVLVYETVDNKEKKVGALIQAWEKVKNKGFQYWIGIDADTKLDPDCVEHLFTEIDENDKIGGVMAKYNFDQGESKGLISGFLFRMQRLEFTGWINDLLHRKRETYVLGGQASIFRMEALEKVSQLNNGKRKTPWSTTTLVEDMEITWKLNEAGYSTMVSEEARAWPGAMSSFHSLWAQRRKWDQGIASLLHDDNKFPASVLKTPKRIQMKSLLDMSVRFFFLLLLIVSLVFNMFTWFWIWIIPPILAVILNAYMASITPKRSMVDIILAGTLIGPEIYLFFRLAGWSTSWLSVLRGKKFDGWAKQYSAEAGKSSWVTKLLVVAGVVAIGWFLAVRYDIIGKLRTWQGESGQWVNSVVNYGWIFVTILTAIAVIDMLFRIFRSDHGMRP